MGGAAVMGGTGAFTLRACPQAWAAGKELLGERLNGGILVGNSRVELLVQQVFQLPGEDHHVA